MAAKAGLAASAAEEARNDRRFITDMAAQTFATHDTMPEGAHASNRG
jgi:hypothetical protein